MDATQISLLAILPILLAVAYFDLRFLRIPNLLSLLALVIFAILAAVSPMPDLVGRLVAAGILFAAGFMAFALRLVGAGDVKFLSALVLLVPTASLPVFANLFAAALLAGIACILAMRRLPIARRSTWKSLTTARSFPVGLSISVAGFAFFAVEAGLFA